MKYIILTVLFIASALNADSQVYNATYRFSIAYNLEPYKDELLKPDFNISMDDSNSTVYRELLKYNYCNNIIKARCSKDACIFKSGPISAKVAFKFARSGYMEYDTSFDQKVLEYNGTYKRLSIRKVSNNESTSCFYIDTSNLHFSKIGNVKKIGNWNCVEYVSGSNNDLVSLWICLELQPYLSPGIYGLGLPGGVVEVEYHKNNSRLTLTNLDSNGKIDLKAYSHYKCDDPDPTRKYDVLNQTIRRL